MNTPKYHPLDAPPETGEFPQELLSIDAIIKAAREGKELPYWIENGGNFLDRGIFNPNAFEVGRMKRKGQHFELQSNPGKLLADPFDPNNMIFVKDAEKKIDDLMKRLEKAAKVAKSQNKLVLLVVGKGGTIAMRPAKDGTMISELSAHDITEEAGAALKRKFIVVDFDICSIDSSQYQWAFTGDATILKSLVVTKAGRDLFERLCIMTANGTDTCIEDASNQKMQLGPQFPIGDGWVSANETSVAAPSDVGPNVVSTGDLLAHQHRAKMRGVFVNQGGTNGAGFNPLQAVKAKDGHVNIYSSPFGEPYANLGTFLRGGWTDPMIREYQAALAGSTAEVNRDFCPIIIDGPSAGTGSLDLGNPALTLDAKVGTTPLETLIALRMARMLQKEAVLMITFGSFTFNEQRLTVIEKECRRDLMIIASSPFALGETHKYPSAERIIRMGGVVTTMSPHATMLQLMFAQQVWGNDRERIMACLNDRDVVGEKPRYNRDKFDGIGSPMELQLSKRDYRSSRYLGTKKKREVR